MINCPKCNDEVNKFLPIDNLDGSTLWECDNCLCRFKTDKNDEIVVLIKKNS